MNRCCQVLITMNVINCQISMNLLTRRNIMYNNKKKKKLDEQKKRLPGIFKKVFSVHKPKIRNLFNIIVYINQSILTKRKFFFKILWNESRITNKTSIKQSSKHLVAYQVCVHSPKWLSLHISYVFHCFCCWFFFFFYHFYLLLFWLF